MSHSILPVPRISARLLALLLLASACSEPPFAHTNPLDPEFEGSYVLMGGPDTLSRTFVPFPMHIEGTPALSPTIRVLWSTNHPRLHVDGIGSVFAEPTLQPTVGTITATVGSHQAERSFVMLQHAASVVTTCTTLTPCDSIDVIDSQFEFGVGGSDTFGRTLVDVAFSLNEQASVIRDPSLLASVVASQADRRRFTSLANGVTWVMIDLGDYRDSVRIVVRQHATAWTNLCPETVAVGETSTLRALDFEDRNGHPLAVDVLGVPAVEWRPGQAIQEGASATVDPSGTITGVAPGEWITSSFLPGFEESMECVVTVVDP